MERREIEYFKFLNYMGKLLTSGVVEKNAKHFPVLDILAAGVNTELQRIHDENSAG